MTTPDTMHERLTTSLHSAVEWLTGVATVRDNLAVGERGRRMLTTHWNGAIRGEYRAATKQWDSFCPVWHTGQAVKGMVMAAKALNHPQWLDAARYSADFILNNRVADGPDRGLILAFEDRPDKVNISAVLECLDGLFYLSEATGDPQYRQAALDALQWIGARAWNPREGTLHDVYDPRRREFDLVTWGSLGRPMLDDAVFLTGWRLTGDASFKDVAVGTAERLLRDEAPPGNWVNYLPCNSQKGNIHPRHAYWWGLPMLDVYEATKDARFRDCFVRSVEWYKRAMRRDGGLLRKTYLDFNTESFGHATSGSACAVIMFLRHYEHTGDRGILEFAERGLRFAMGMQFTQPEDPNLKGCILEKVLPPDGTDRSPYHVRDLGTIFFVQAAARWLMDVRAD